MARAPPGRVANGAGTPYQRLKLLVIRHRFRPQEPLRPVDLAPRLQVSATPIREALTRLYAEGLIMQVPNKGFFAKPLTEHEVVDLFEHAFLLMRHAIEKDVLGFTLSGINKPMELTFDADGKVVDVTEDLVHSHAKFLEQLWERVVSVARNDSMLATIRSFNDRTHYVRLLDLRAPGHLDEIAPLVFGLIGRLQDGDVPGVAANLAEQAGRMRRVLPGLVKEGVARAHARPEGNAGDG